MAQETLSRGNISRQFIIGPTLTPVAVAQNTTAEQSFTVSGVLTTDMIDVQTNLAITAGLGIINCRVSAANTVQIGFCNTTAGSLTPPSGQYLMVVTRCEDPIPLNAA